jgi:hypothetical protein
VDRFGRMTLYPPRGHSLQAIVPQWPRMLDAVWRRRRSIGGTTGQGALTLSQANLAANEAHGRHWTTAKIRSSVEAPAFAARVGSAAVERSTGCLIERPLIRSASSLVFFGRIIPPDCHSC